MIKRAYNKMQKEGHLLDGPFVVVFDNNNNLIEYHFLAGEEPMTEWIGGTLQIS